MTLCPEQEAKEFDYGVVFRLNPQSGVIENLEILCFSARVTSSENLQLSILAKFHLSERYDTGAEILITFTTKECIHGRSAKT
jgi:hypothetical protein